MKKTYGALRKAGIAEGISFIVLVFIAMPLKYFANMPEAVKYTGWVHGLLFVTYIGLAYFTKESFNKPFSWLMKCGLAAILPFGTFIWDKQLKKEEQALN